MQISSLTKPLNLAAVFLFLAVLGPLPLFANQCRDLWVGKIPSPRLTKNDLIQPIFLKGADVPVTFSYDSEIQVSHFFRRSFALDGGEVLMKALNEARESLQKKPSNFDFLAPNDRNHIIDIQKRNVEEFNKNVEEIFRHFESSAIQVDFKYFQNIVQRLEGQVLEVLYKRLSDHLQPVFQRAGIQAEVGRDGNDPEARHPKYDEVFSVYWNSMKSWERVFPKANTHYHVGLPVAAISPKTFLSISKNIETLVVLDLARDLDTSTSTMAYTVSTISQKSPSGLGARRGVIKAELDAFPPDDAPKIWHDLEIRQHTSSKRAGLMMLEVVNMARNAEHLKGNLGEQNFEHELFKSEAGNVSGALFRAGQLLQSGDKSDQAAGKKLIHLAKDLRKLDEAKKKNRNHVSFEEKSEARSRIVQVIRETEVIDRLMTGNFW